MSDKKTNKETNYYLQDRYLSGEMNTDKISFDPDTSNRLYIDNSQESLKNKDNIQLLENEISKNLHIKDIIDNLPLERTINMPIQDVNKIYSFCMGLLQNGHELSKLTKIEMFSLVTDYINLNEKETKYFYRNLSVKFKSDLLDELRKAKLYKDNKLF